ncbi:competence protein ComEC [Pseudodesulfovibrio sp. F-1]|uniref:Competence protein ComEC n=1 Tax=Pseudodesulfovibrio alkaliphilus TaxID=2661613 RepID=A0A7K1KNL6_9BACT|nr:competence protein ComEC [Pseudodesulfovibrio alkaliphilus]
MPAAEAWFSDPVFWIAALPALAVSGLLVQMVASLFTCCATFRLRGRTVRLRWWMIPVAAAASIALWGVAAVLAVQG